MKLILDIPDSDYTAVRCEGLYYIGHDKLAESVTTAFQTATPYEENSQGDLISREALKETLKSYPQTDDMRTTELIGFFETLIDNAPAVEYTFEEAFQKTVCENRLYCPERPKGEWINCGWSIRCSICNYDMPYTVRNFCPNCGADMQKGVNK